MVSEERAKELIRQGYKQVSKKYRGVARLPAGKTGVEMLLEMAQARNPVFTNVEGTRRDSSTAGGGLEATGFFLRVYAPQPPFRDGCYLELDCETFEAFHRLGGETA